MSSSEFTKAEWQSEAGVKIPLETLIDKWKHAQAGAIYAARDFTDEQGASLINRLIDERERSVSRLHRELIVGALKWYGNKAHYEESAPGKGEIDGEFVVMTDGGCRARYALRVIDSPQSGI